MNNLFFFFIANQNLLSDIPRNILKMLYTYYINVNTKCIYYYTTHTVSFLTESGMLKYYVYIEHMIQPNTYFENFNTPEVTV